MVVETVVEEIGRVVHVNQSRARAWPLTPYWLDTAGGQGGGLPCPTVNGSTDGGCTHYDNRSLWNMSLQLFGTDGAGIGDSIFDILYIRVIFIVLYGAVFACCSVGNLLVIVVVLGHRKMRTTTNFFLANLAVADLSVGIFCVLPNLGMYLSPYWFLGKVMCKLLYFVQMMAYAASITVLTVISIERYFAILHPLRSKQWKTLFLLRVIVFLIWLAAAVCGIPQLVFYNTVDLPSGEDSIVTFCITVIQHDRQAYVTINFVLWYMVPLSLMILMYSRISVVLWKTSKPDRSMSGPSIWSWKTKRMRIQSNTILESHVTTDRPSTSPKLRGSTCETSLVCHESSGQRVGSKHRDKGRGLKANMETDQLERSFGIEEGDSLHVDIVDDQASDDTILEIDEWPSKPATKSKTADKHKEQKRSTGDIEMQKISRPPTAGCLMNENSYNKEPQTDTPTRKETGQKFVRFTGVQPRWERNENALIARRRVIRLLIAIIICFAICVMPYHIFMMWQTWRSSHHNRDTYGQMLAAPITFLIFYFNSALNPVLYAFLSENFRRSLRELVRGNKTTVQTNRTRRSTLTKTNNTTV